MAENVIYRIVIRPADGKVDVFTSGGSYCWGGADERWLGATPPDSVQRAINGLWRDRPGKPTPKPKK